jgi:hypothetical protein
MEANDAKPFVSESKWTTILFHPNHDLFGQHVGKCEQAME